jgi:hypothetical protein
MFEDIVTRVTGQLALLRYCGWWPVLGSYPGFGIGDTMMRRMNNRYRKYPPRDDRKERIRYSGSEGRIGGMGWNELTTLGGIRFSMIGMSRW